MNMNFNGSREVVDFLCNMRLAAHRLGEIAGWTKAMPLDRKRLGRIIRRVHVNACGIAFPRPHFIGGNADVMEFVAHAFSSHDVASYR
jgi:hypothetical protein